MANADAVAKPWISDRDLAIAERVIGLALALLLLRSSFAHLGNIYYFLSSIYEYDLLTVQQGKWLSVALPVLQLLCAACLIGRWWPRDAYLVAALQFLVFVAVQVITIRRGLEISCGCFGASASLQVGPPTLLVAGACLVGSVVGCWLTVIRQSREATI